MYIYIYNYIYMYLQVINMYINIYIYIYAHHKYKRVCQKMWDTPKIVIQICCNSDVNLDSLDLMVFGVPYFQRDPCRYFRCHFRCYE